MVLKFRTFPEGVVCCIQDTLSSRAALGLPAASREQRYLAYKVVCESSDVRKFMKKIEIPKFLRALKS